MDAARIEGLFKLARRRRLDAVLVTGQAGIFAVTGVNSDNAVLECTAAGAALYTDFRYIPAARRIAPDLKVRDIKNFKPSGSRIGIEFSMPYSQYLKFKGKTPRSKFVDIGEDLAAMRAVKTGGEIERIRAAESLACEIWTDASALFRAGMTELDMARIIGRMEAERGDGEAFPTIVCVGANAAECHHEPDGTVWNGRDPVLVDMGVRLAGACSDLTRNILPERCSRLYRQVYGLVFEANRAAIAAAKPGMPCRRLDAVARGIIRRGGFGRCFGHSLGHGVGCEVHEAPSASCRSREVLAPGMVVTVEPGIYLEGNLGVRIEDLVLITDDGCEVLSSKAPVAVPR